MSKKNIINGLYLVIFMLCVSLSAVPVKAQNRAQDSTQRNLRHNLFTLRALRMTQELELTEQQTAAIFPELNRAEKDKAELQKALASELRELRLMLKNDKSKAEDYEERVNRIKDLRRQLQEREKVFEDFLFSQLTAVQKARYIIFSFDFNRTMIERTHRMKMGGQKVK